MGAPQGLNAATNPADKAKKIGTSTIIIFDNLGLFANWLK